MSSVSQKYEETYKSIIRPFREEYDISSLGQIDFEIHDKIFHREDLILQNSRGLRLQCSFYQQRVSVPLPCVIYLHTHTGSRLEAKTILPVLLPSNINIFTFDFSGSGLSEGKYVSLGWHEKEDLDTVVKYLRASGKITCLGLWGRGMGAVTALLYADRDPIVGGMVLDSPFLSLRSLAEAEISKRCSVPGFVKNTAISFVRNSILKEAKFDVNDINTLEHVVCTFVPVLFCRGKSDDFVPEQHVYNLFDSYQGDKKLTEVDGHHNSIRPQFFLDSAAIFFYNTLMCESINLESAVVEKEVLSDDSYELL
jgi:pimeloyl-ACP methyl ester carboxylesterase